MHNREINKISLSPEQKKEAIRDIRYYFETERGELIGDLAADQYLDFIIDKMGSYIYNQAVMDIQKYMEVKVEDIYGFMK
jgi:uncharacterized protein (DUF2164 family)